MQPTPSEHMGVSECNDQTRYKLSASRGQTLAMLLTTVLKMLKGLKWVEVIVSN